MATIGLRDLFYAPITTATDGKETYGTPVRMAKAINADLSVEVAEATLYADDAIDVQVKEFVGGTLTLQVNDLAPQIRAVVLGQTQDADGAVLAGENDVPPYLAVGFRARKTGGEYKYIWLYKIKFGIPNETYATKGQSIAFNTPSIVGSFQKRPDGNWKIDYEGLPSDPVASNWFKQVREFNAAQQAPDTP